MATTITYPAMDLGGNKANNRRPRRRNTPSDTSGTYTGTVAALTGLGVMALAGAAAAAWKRPSIALGGLLIGALTAGLVFEHGAASR